VLAFKSRLIYNANDNTIKINKVLVMERQNRQNYRRSAGPIHVPQRDGRTFAMAQRGAASSSLSAQFSSPNSPQATPAMPVSRTKFDNSDTNRVTFDQIANNNSSATPISLQPSMATSGGAVAVTPMEASLFNESPLYDIKAVQKISDGMQHISNKTKSITQKIKNSPQVNKLAAKVKMPENYEVRPSDIVRYGVVTVCLLIAGFLAFDTWQTNQQIQDTFTGGSTPAAAASMGVAGSDGDRGDGYEVSPDMPRKILIPSIGVDAKVSPVGLSAGNQIGLPHDEKEAGWYDGSAKPGTPGVAFIAGHFGIGTTGVFNNLANVNVGDKVQVELGDGLKINYEVYDKQTIPVGSMSMADILTNSRDYSESLNLMTCIGQFNGHQFTHRLIVFAKRVS